MKAPFPYFGGKSRIADEVFRRFGKVDAYSEPFAGSLAVLLANPCPPAFEVVNDADALLVNFWRAIKANPKKVASFADWPINELDLHARHKWLVEWKLTNAKLFKSPTFYDPKVAGWWVWGISCWLGGSWGEQIKNPPRRRPESKNQGINTRLSPPNVSRRGISLKGEAALVKWFERIADRLSRVRVLWGDWSRAVTPSMTTAHGVCGVFLDPPYSVESGRDMRTYSEESDSVAHVVREWAISNGNNPKLKIALCGLETEHGQHMPGNWGVYSWASTGGYGGNERRHLERVWFSPNCNGAQLGFEF